MVRESVSEQYGFKEWARVIQAVWWYTHTHTQLVCDPLIVRAG